MGFLRAVQSDKHSAAAMYLQLSDSERRAQGAVLARQLQDLLDRAFTGHLPLSSDQPDGTLTDDLDANREVLGTITSGGKTIQLLLVRTPPAPGPRVWLVAAETLREIPDLHAKLGHKPWEGIPDFLVRILRFQPSQWLLFAIFLPVSWVAAKLIVWSVTAISRAAKRWRHLETPDRGVLRQPFTLLLALVAHAILTTRLELPLLIRYRYSRVSWILITFVMAWLVSRLAQRTAALASRRFSGSKWAAAGAAVLLGRRVFDTILGIVVVLLSLNILGFDTRTALTGLGIGGIALALGMQKTLENFVGGVSLLSDGMLRIGDRYKLGDRVGTVEDVRLRSTTLRTIEGTVLTIPNGALAIREIETLPERQRILLQSVIRLSRETTFAQLRNVLAEISHILTAQEKVEQEDARVRLVGFGESSLDLEVYAYVQVSESPEFLAIQESILFQIMSAIEASGTRLAFTTHMVVVADNGLTAHGPQAGALPLLKGSKAGGPS
jgi:MscS family membrane protein